MSPGAPEFAVSGARKQISEPWRLAAESNPSLDGAGSNIRRTPRAATSPNTIGGARDELHAAYLAHMPMKRMVFLHGYLDRPFEVLWDQLHVD